MKKSVILAIGFITLSLYFMVLFQPNLTVVGLLLEKTHLIISHDRAISIATGGYQGWNTTAKFTLGLSPIYTPTPVWDVRIYASDTRPPGSIQYPPGTLLDEFWVDAITGREQAILEIN